MELLWCFWNKQQRNNKSKYWNYINELDDILLDYGEVWNCFSIIIRYTWYRKVF